MGLYKMVQLVNHLPVKALLLHPLSRKAKEMGTYPRARRSCSLKEAPALLTNGGWCAGPNCDVAILSSIHQFQVNDILFYRANLKLCTKSDTTWDKRIPSRLLPHSSRTDITNEV